jgi:tetratricopeptide (TPR) repeat protein
MEKALEKLGGLDPSDSMDGIMKAVSDVIKLVENDPESKEASKALDLIFDQEEKTRDYYMRPLDSDEIYNALVQIHIGRGEDKMADHYRRCLDLRQARKWTIIGDSYALLGLNMRAVKYLKRALFFGPTEDLVEEVQKAHDKALKRVEKASSEIDTILSKLEKDPDHVKNRLKAISSLIDLDRLDEAGKILKKAIKNSPDDFDLIYRQGCVMFGADDFKKAKKTFTKALELNENSTNAKRAFNLTEEMLKGIN